MHLSTEGGGCRRRADGPTRVLPGLGGREKDSENWERVWKTLSKCVFIFTYINHLPSQSPESGMLSTWVSGEGARGHRGAEQPCSEDCGPVVRGDQALDKHQGSKLVAQPSCCQEAAGGGAAGSGAAVTLGGRPQPHPPVSTAWMEARAVGGNSQALRWGWGASWTDGRGQGGDSRGPGCPQTGPRVFRVGIWT